MHQLLVAESEPGTRSIVAGHSEWLVTIDSGDTACFTELDTRQDLQKIQLDDAIGMQ